ncbi:MAG: glycoside hydrolase family 9 protein [Cytophagaceae bacterium]|nr:glycoside hydrolase family 9 protein [Cytophagaceae bacterium]
MKRFNALFLIISFFFIHSSFAGRYVRYNLAGYNPQRKKTLIIMSDNNCINTPWRIKDKNAAVVLSGTVPKSIASAGIHTPKFFNHEIDFSSLSKEGIYTFEIDNTDTFNIKIAKQPYAEYTDDILRYLRSQRCGTDQCVDHKPCHSGDKTCSIHRRKDNDNKSWSFDPANKSVNMLGGWHDAGDYIKFTLTTAYTTYFVLRSYEAYPEIFNKKEYSRTDLIDILDEAKWGLDYLVKCMPDTTEFIIQAGGIEDHHQGLRLPEKDILNGNRECYSAMSPTQMGYTAAALALGAKIFNSIGKKEEAKKYEEMAKKIYRLALSNDKDINAAWYEKDFAFYGDNSKNDNMQLASVELYNLTNDKSYLKRASDYAEKAQGAGWAAWPSVNMFAHARLCPYNNAVLTYMEYDLNSFQAIAREENNIWGVPHKYTWATLYSFFSVSNASLLHMQYTQEMKYNEMIYDVIDYTFGKNNWGVSMIALKEINPSVRNIYSQVYALQPDLYPAGAIAEGSGDNETHKNLMQYFKISETDPYHKFNTSDVVFYDNNTDFQCMETTITGLADGLFLLTLASKVSK